MEIEALCPDHFFHRIRNQVTDRLAISDTFADESCRDVEHRRLHHSNVRMGLELRRLCTGTGINVEAVILKNSFVVFPLYKIRKVIFPYDHLEFFFGMFLG